MHGLKLTWAIALLLGLSAPALAGRIATPETINEGLVAKVDISDQTMSVFLDGKRLYTWLVSTARPGKSTPRGTFKPDWLSRHHYSSLYNNAPMPYSVFFQGNYAIHGTDAVSRLGRVASAGCVRLHPDNASQLFDLVRKVGRGNTFIVITD